jgi:hypothetical protein
MQNALKAVAFAIVLGASSAHAQSASQEWDGLVRVTSPHFDAAYLAPGADFSGYTKVMLDPTEVAFHQNWLTDFNSSARGAQNRLSEDDAREILTATQAGVQEVFAAVYAERGFQVVTTPGPDVLRLRTSVTNLAVEGVERMSTRRSETYSTQAGEATITIEARDSMSGALLGRGVDRRTAGESAFTLARTSERNRADFEALFRSWAELSADALVRLRETPAPPAGAVGQH